MDKELNHALIAASAGLVISSLKIQPVVFSWYQEEWHTRLNTVKTFDCWNWILTVKLVSLHVDGNVYSSSEIWTPYHLRSCFAYDQQARSDKHRSSCFRPLPLQEGIVPARNDLTSVTVVRKSYNDGGFYSACLMLRHNRFCGLEYPSHLKASMYCNRLS